MAQISVTIPDAVLARVLDAFATNHGWNQTLGITKAQFAKRQVIGFIKANVAEYEVTLAGEIARKEARDKIDNEITLT